MAGPERVKSDRARILARRKAAPPETHRAAVVIPIRDENPASLAPVMTRILIGLNVGAFFYELSLGPALRDFMMQWGLVPVRLAAGLASGLGITLLTSMFLHGGWMHLLGNMWYLGIFGDNVEDRLGHFGYLAFYLVSGLVGGLLHYAFQRDLRDAHGRRERRDRGRARRLSGGVSHGARAHAGAALPVLPAHGAAGTWWCSAYGSCSSS